MSSLYRNKDCRAHRGALGCRNQDKSSRPGTGCKKKTLQMKLPPPELEWFCHFRTRCRLRTRGSHWRSRRGRTCNFSSQLVSIFQAGRGTTEFHRGHGTRNPQDTRHCRSNIPPALRRRTCTLASQGLILPRRGIRMKNYLLYSHKFDLHYIGLK